MNTKSTTNTNAKSTATATATATTRALTIEEIYKKKNPVQHILDLPDTVIGSIDVDTREMHVYDDETSKIVKRDITFVPGFYKTCDELIVNVADHQVRDPTCRIAKFNVDKEVGVITCWNNGNGVPVQIHSEHNMYVPELIFGNLLTSSNYDQKGKTTGGKNGYGAKLANIFSLKFIVETADVVNKKSMCKSGVIICLRRMSRRLRNWWERRRLRQDPIHKLHIIRISNVLI